MARRLSHAGWSAVTPVARVRRLAACTAIVVSAACAESSLVPPTAPSALNPEKVGELALECPADQRAQSRDGQPVRIDYPAPTVRGGEAPITVGCEPQSGTSFPVGASTVSCRAAGALGQSATCAFVVRVLPPPMLGVTRILAFGDSLTYGVLSGGAEPGGRSYPAQLEQRLRSAYPAQSILVVNEGVPGEEAVDAPGRLASALALHQPEVVILLEGTNDLSYPDDRSAAALEAIDELLILVQRAGAAPVLANLPPVRAAARTAHAARIAGFNRALREMAMVRGAVLVDVHGVLASGACVPAGGMPLPCIGPDGLHPTAEGYGLMADAFFDHLVREHDQPAAGSARRTPVAAPGGGAPRVD